MRKPVREEGAEEVRTNDEVIVTGGGCDGQKLEALPQVDRATRSRAEEDSSEVESACASTGCSGASLCELQRAMRRRRDR